MLWIRNNDEYLQRGLDFSSEKSSVVVDGTEEGDGSSKENDPCTSLVVNIGATYLSNALLHNTHLLCLNISLNDIGCDGGMTLAQCLNYLSDTTFQSRTALRVLYVSHRTHSYTTPVHSHSSTSCDTNITAPWHLEYHVRLRE